MEIRGKVMSALRWSAAARFFGQAVSWAITILVIRLLAPGDYGLMAMAMVVVSFLVLLNTLGLDAVLVQDKSLDEPMRRRGFERRNPFMAEATPDDHWVASWLRLLPDDTDLDTRIGPVGGYDGVTVWSDGYLVVGMQGV